MQHSLLDRIMNGLDKAVQWLCVVFMALVVFAVSWQVLARYVTRASSSWTVDLAALAFVWLSMFAIALGVRQGRHMVLDIWEFFAHRRWLTVLITTVASLLVLLTIAALVWYGFQALPSAMRRTMPGLGVPFGLVSLAVPVGSILCAIFAVEAWVRTVMNKDLEADPLPSHIIFQPAGETVVKGEI
ncbi:TRAP transporter small permease [Microbacterium sp. YY-01]|uniref:TRAP transporter small permease n=1 Tax=Microbacterium sp. YY-01 TaxID=3421634 RepID=UPI003D176433